MSLAEYLSAAADGNPVPGGGSTAALAGALGCSMALMAITISSAAPGASPELAQMSDFFSSSLDEFAQRVDADATAYSQFRENLKIQSGTAAQRAMRGARLQMALGDTVRVPLEVAGQAATTLVALVPLVSACAPSVLSNVGAASSLLRASFESARFTAMVNMKMINDPQLVSSLSENLSKYGRMCEKSHRKIAKSIASGLEPDEKP